MPSYAEIHQLVISAPENSWVAIDGATKRIVGCAENIADARAQAEKAGFPYPILEYHHPTPK